MSTNIKKSILLFFLVASSSILVRAVNNPTEPALRFPSETSVSYNPELTSAKMALDIKAATSGRTFEQWTWLRAMYREVYVNKYRFYDFLFVNANNQIQSGPSGHYYRQSSWVNDSGRLVGGIMDGYYGGTPFGVGGWPTKAVGRYAYKAGGWTHLSSFSLYFWARTPPPEREYTSTYQFTWRLRALTIDPTGVQSPTSTIVVVRTIQTFDFDSISVVNLPSFTQIGSHHFEIDSVQVENLTSGFMWTNVSIDPSINPQMHHPE